MWLVGILFGGGWTVDERVLDNGERLHNITTASRTELDGPLMAEELYYPKNLHLETKKKKKKREKHLVSPP